jgi:pSer/pThr/pTyr-binding forkhead associated (FHA) protein
LTLPHPLVSRRHCELFEKAGVLHVRDLKSLNGTYVDSQRIEGTSELHPDQLLTIGNVTFRAIYNIAESNGHVSEKDRLPGPAAGHSESQVLEFDEVASSDADSKVDEDPGPIHERKTTPGKNNSAAQAAKETLRSRETQKATADNSDVLDDRDHDTPVGNAQSQHSVCKAMRSAGISAGECVKPDSLSEIRQRLPGLPKQALASDIDGLELDNDAVPGDRDEDFDGLDLDKTLPSRVRADESALGSFIRKLPR